MSVMNADKKQRFILLGNPIPLARPRMSRHGHVWDCQKQTKERAQLEIMAQLSEQRLHEQSITHTDQTVTVNTQYPFMRGALVLNIAFFMPVPQKMNTHAKRPQALATPHTTKPDLSNLIKFVEDVCNQLLYADDAQIVEIQATKQYDTVPRTEFSLHER